MITHYIGCAGWHFSPLGNVFGEGMSALARYATRFNAVEINSTFKSKHQQRTFVRWAEAVPPDFRFSVKMPKEITHERRLEDCREQLLTFLDAVSGLGIKLGPLLVQLPPKLEFQSDIAEKFFSFLRSQYDRTLVCEPRHESWSGKETAQLFSRYQILYVTPDPPAIGNGPTPEQQGGAYYRLHGSPHMYYSSYSDDFLLKLADKLSRSSQFDVWCIFDNTARGHAVANALQTQTYLQEQLH